MSNLINYYSQIKNDIYLFILICLYLDDFKITEKEQDFLKIFRDEKNNTNGFIIRNCNSGVNQSVKYRK